MARNKIPELLEQRNMTPYRLAKVTGMSQNRIYSLVNAPEIPPRTTWETIKKLRDALGLKCAEELEETDDG